jgi:heavy metal translocating P-type ATPase
MSAAADVAVVPITAEAPPQSAGLLSRRERHWLGLRLTLALIAAGLLMVSTVIHIAAPDRRDIAELVAGCAAILVAVPALAAAWHSLRFPDLHGLTDQLIGLALIAAWAAGDLVTAALLPLVMTIGHVLEERSLLGAQEAIRALGRLTAVNARRVLPDGRAETVPSRALRAGDIIDLRPGERIAADGLVRSGHGSVDTSSITGESVPVEVAPADSVFGGSINLDGALVVEVTRIGGQTALGRVIAMLQEAERAKPPITRLLEGYAGQYMVLVLLLSAAVWFVSGSTAGMLAVLVASCPCALVLAAPATSVAAIAVAARHGILVKGAAFLENLASVDSVVLDKTGTVTLGQLRLLAAEPAPGVERRELTVVAATLGATSNHPVSRALSALIPADQRLSIDDVRETRGCGIVARCNGTTIALGRPELLEELGLTIPSPPAHDGPLAGVARGQQFLGWMLLADEPRPESRQALAELRNLGLRREILLTGDRRAVAERVARFLEVREVRAEALPEQKLRCVLDEVKAGYRPMVVGDGINDSLALKAGAVGIAMGARGTDVALASADLVLMTDDLRRLGTCIRLSRRCRRTIYVNVALGLGWTVLIVVAAGTGMLGASGALIAAVLHNVGTLAVMANAGRLLKFQDA